jgi:ABC-type glycerol-3-phosphate transport system substrate-binding protein
MSNDKRFSRRHFIKKSAVLGVGGAAAIGAGGLLAACGDSPTATTAATSATTAAANTTAATSATTAASAATTAAGGTTAAASATTSAVRASGEITYWDWFVSQGPALDEEIKLFQAATGITVKKTTNQKDNYNNLFGLAVKGGNAPDVFQIPDQPSFQEIVSNGWLADLNRFADFDAFKARFPDPTQNFLEGTNTIAGKTYSAPRGKNDDGMWIQLWVNTKVFKDAGIVDASGNAKLPQTADDMLAAAQAIKEKSGGKTYGFAFPGKNNVYHWFTYLAALSGVTSAEGGAEDGFDTKTGKYSMATNPVYRQAIDLVLKMRDSDYVLPDSATIDDEALRVLFAQNRFGMYLNGNWIVASFKKAAPDFKDYAVTHVPYLGGVKEAKSFFYTGPGGQLFGINPKSKNINAAWEFFKWLHTPEATERWFKAGHGASIFPAANKPEYLDDPALRTLLTLGPQFSRVGPRRTLRNPELSKVKVQKPKPDINQIIQGIYTGQLTDINGALRDYDAAQQKALEQAIADAKAAGAKVSIEDFIFADWDPTKNYVTKPR